MQLQYQLGNGSWVNCGERSDEFLARAAKFNNISIDDATAKLSGGAELHHGSDWDDCLRDKIAHDSKMEKIHASRQSVEMVKCSCGHTVPRASVMSASMGTSCPDCYDRMSN